MKSAQGDRRIGAARFKARCLALLDDVAATRRAIVVTKRGRPVARIVPAESDADDLTHSVLLQKDLVSPLDEEWDVES